MFICEVCDTEITPGQTMVQKVVGWVEVKGTKLVGSVMKPSHALGYAHKICLSTKKADEQPTLW